MAGNGKKFLIEVYIALLAMASAALLIALYHCISMLWWDHRHRHTHARRRPRPAGIQLQGVEATGSMENSLAGLIPAHKHQKNMDTGLGKEEEGDMCAVCLCEFEEGEELRTLPECLHSFHAPCIDMWLYSHDNCPMCRTNATSIASPQVEVICIRESELVGRPTGLASQDVQVVAV